MKNKIGGICPHCSSFKYCRNAGNGVKACINYNKFPKEGKDQLSHGLKTREFGETQAHS